MSFMLMSPAMLSSPKVDARMKKFAEAEVAAEVAAKSVADPVKSAEAAQAAKQAVLQEIEEADALEEDDSDDEKGVLQTVKDAIVAFDDAVTSGLSKIDQKLGFSAAVHKVDDKLKIGDKALAVAKAADENLIRPVVFGVTRAAGAFKRKLVKKKVVVKKKGSVVKSDSSAALDLPSPASDSKAESPSTDDTVMDVDDGQEMKEMTGVRVPSQSMDEKTIDEDGDGDGDESEYEEIEVEEEVEVLEEVSDDEATPTPATATVISPGKTSSSPPTSTPNTSRPTTQSRTPTSTTSSTVTSSSAAVASSSTSPRQSSSTSSTPRQRRRSSIEAAPDVV